MNLGSLKTRIVSLSVVSLLATVGALYGFSSYFAGQLNDESAAKAETLLDAASKEKLRNLADAQAGTIRLEVETSFNAARNMAKAMEGVSTGGDDVVPAELRRGFLNRMLLKVLEDNAGFNGTYSAWEPDALDGADATYRDNAKVGSDQTGRALPYWTRDMKGTIAVQPLVEYDSTALHPNGLVKGGWYLGPKQTGKESILAPLPYIVQGKAVFLATMSVPVSVDDRFVGVVGADFNLDFVQKLAEKVDTGVYGGQGTVTIVTQSGLVVADSGDPSVIGGSWERVNKDWQEDLKAVESAVGDTLVTEDDGQVKVFSPVPLGRTGQTWSVVIAVPKTVVMEDVSVLQGDLASLRGSADFWMLVVAAGVALLGAVVMWLVSLSVARPIQALTRAMEALAGRQTGVVVPGTERRDEIGAMARTVGTIQQNAVEDAESAAAASRDRDAKAALDRAQAMTAMADQFERAVGGVISAVGVASGQLQQAAKSLSSTADDTTERSAVVSQASEEASANVNMVASAAEELASSVGEISRQVDESARIAATAVGEASSTASTVRDLSEAAQRIGQISELIGNVAAQTNLLALNATIEAARAGEAGRGFAVVAAEVKGLADQTGKAAAQINEQISGIQNQTHTAVNAISSIARIIEQMNTIASTIASAVEQQAATTSEIAGNINRASTGTVEVSRNIATVRQAAEGTSAAAAQVLGSSEQLALQSDSLRREVQNFLATVRQA